MLSTDLVEKSLEWYAQLKSLYTSFPKRLMFQEKLSHRSYDLPNVSLMPNLPFLTQAWILMLAQSWVEMHLLTGCMQQPTMGLVAWRQRMTQHGSVQAVGSSSSWRDVGGTRRPRV